MFSPTSSTASNTGDHRSSTTSKPETPNMSSNPKAGARSAFRNRSPLPSSTELNAQPGMMLGARTTSAVASMRAPRPTHALMLLRNLK